MGVVAEERPLDRKTVLVAVGQRVRSARAAKGISQEQLADLANLHRTYVGAVERGERNPTVVSLYRLARALTVRAADLLPDLGIAGQPGEAVILTK